MKIGDTNKKILNHIQDFDLCKPRFTKIAKDLGLPTSTVHEKIKKMEENGVIKGYSVLIDPEKVNRDFVVFILGQMDFSKLKEDKGHFEKVARELKQFSFVQEVYFIAGEWDIMCKLRCKDKEDYYNKQKKIIKHFYERGESIVTTHTFKDTSKLRV